MTRTSVWTSLAVAVALATGSGAASQEADRQTSRDPAVALAAERVRQADRDDLFFWKRFLIRAKASGEFDLPPEWYQPNVLVEGEPDEPFIARAPVPSARLAAALVEVDHFAAANETQALIVLHDGKIIHERYADGVHPGSLIAVKSFAKTLPALLVGIAIGEGKIGGLDDPVERYVGEWRGDPRGRITLRQLLTWSSGLARVPLEIKPDNRILRLSEGADVNRAILDWPLGSPPGGSPGLNHVDQQLLALVIERATGQSYQRYLSEKLWRPIGASTAAFNTDANGRARAFCCLLAGPRDFLRIGQLLADRGRWRGRQVVPADFIDAMTRSLPGTYFGMSVFTGWSEGAERLAADKGGIIVAQQKTAYTARDLVILKGGLTSYLWVSPSHRLVILRWSEKQGRDWDAAYIPNILAAALPKAAGATVQNSSSSRPR